MKPTKSKAARTRTVAARLPTAQADRIDAAASAAGLTTSEYIARVLHDRVFNTYPVLTALAQIIALRAEASTGVMTDTAILTRLETLIAELIRHAGQEVGQ